MVCFASLSSFFKFIATQIIESFMKKPFYGVCQQWRWVKKGGQISIGKTDATFPAKPRISGF
jgi:hypothetical protein